MPNSKTHKPQKPSPEAGGLEAFFAPGGAISQGIANFEPRPQQLEMAAAVYGAIQAPHHLIVEAGTGVGKSLSYLLPAALWAVKNGKKVIVATHTKALQAQLVKKDLPLVKAIIEGAGAHLSYYLLMGSSNYLCLSRLNRSKKHAPELFEGDSESKTIEVVIEWAKTAASGCRNEVPVPVEQVWDEICRDPDKCFKKKCPSKASCFYYQDVARAISSDIVVVNHHLYFAGMPPLLAYDAVIFDEAHNIEEVAADFKGLSLTDKKIRRFLDEICTQKSKRGLVRTIARPPANWVGEIEQAVGEANFATKAFFEDIREKIVLDKNDKTGYSKTERIQSPDIVKNSLAEPLYALIVLLTQALPFSGNDQEEAEIKGCLKRCMELSADIATFLKCDKADYAYWIEAKQSKKTAELSLHMAPIDISDYLRKDLFEKTCPVILTSATLAVDKSFKAVKDRLGLGKSGELLLDSPFDFKKQAALYMPKGLVNPKEPDYERVVIEKCAELIPAVNGGIFLLFTSWKFLDKAAAILKRDIKDRPLFIQGEQTPHQLIAGFKAAGNGVLLGTATFWQGVDIPGQDLSCVVITRLPFTSPDSPLEQAREEWIKAKGLSFFSSYSLPKAVVKFRQGFGRLIRTKKDFGVVVVLDPRITTHSYGGTFTRSIPQCRALSSLKELKDFLCDRTNGTM